MLHRVLSRLAVVCCAAVWLLAPGPAHAAEFAVFSSGARLAIEGHESLGGHVRLFTGGGGVIEMPASAIVRFEEASTPSAPVPAPEPPESLDAFIKTLAAQSGLPPELIHSVIAAESAYDPAAVSPKGAVGLMQLMPQTARELRVEDRADPRENVRGGTAYLKQLLDRYQAAPDALPLALAAYNAGPAVVERYDGVPPYRETRLFVRRVIERFLALTASEPAR